MLLNRGAMRLLCLLSLIAVISCEDSVFTFRTKKPISVLRKLQTSVLDKTCAGKTKQRLRMPHGTVSQLPVFNRLPTTLIHPNRSGLLHSHNMALSRAFYYSYVLQHFNVSKTDFQDLPGILYMYLSAVADVSANPWLINGSVLLYDAHSIYANWFMTLPFNRTLPLFGVRAIRSDDAQDPENWLREPTLHTIQVSDLGTEQHNYTQPNYINAPWFGVNPNDPSFIPDSLKTEVVGGKKHFFKFDIEWEPKVSITKTFFGPPYSGQLETDVVPVRFTQPWFDCGPSNRALNEWIVSSVAPVVDFMPRYSLAVRLQRPKYVAVVAMDTFLVDIPLNLCPIGVGNPAPNLVAGSDSCLPSTVCEPLWKKGSQFLPVTFQCRCQAGTSGPFYHSGNFMGPNMAAKATVAEYEGNGFKCGAIGNLLTWPTELGLKHHGDSRYKVPFTRRRRAVEAAQNWERDKILDDLEKDIEEHKNKEEKEKTEVGREKEEDEREVEKEINVREEQAQRLMERPTFDGNWLPSESNSTRRKRSAPTPQQRQKRNILTARHPPPISNDRLRFNGTAHDRMYAIFNHMAAVTSSNCKTFRSSDLILPGTSAYGAEEQFKGQASMALRLAHFLSAFLQLERDVQGYTVANMRLGQRLHEHHILGEVLANVAGDTNLASSGVLFARGTFLNPSGSYREAFGPTAFRKGGLDSESFGARDLANFGGYFDLPWFRAQNERWGTNAYGLESFLIKAMVRASEFAPRLTRFLKYPMRFSAPKFEDGYWSRPYFDCEGPVPDWLVTYSVPFFGSRLGRLYFAGVVTASIRLKRLNVNQCPGAFHQPNLFKNTALCPSSTDCDPGWGEGYTWGNYNCFCSTGYEFPFSGERFFFLGSLMETEYRKMIAGKPNLYDILKCRPSGAGKSEITISILAISLLTFFVLF